MTNYNFETIKTFTIDGQSISWASTILKSKAVRPRWHSIVGGVQIEYIEGSNCVALQHLFNRIEVPIVGEGILIHRDAILELVGTGSELFTFVSPGSNEGITKQYVTSVLNKFIAQLGFTMDCVEFNAARVVEFCRLNNTHPTDTIGILAISICFTLGGNRYGEKAMPFYRYMYAGLSEYAKNPNGLFQFAPIKAEWDLYAEAAGVKEQQTATLNSYVFGLMTKDIKFTADFWE